MRDYGTRYRYLVNTLKDRCARCGGATVREEGEASCLSCGRPPGAVPREILETLGSASRTGRSPVHGKISLG